MGNMQQRSGLSEEEVRLRRNHGLMSLININDDINGSEFLRRLVQVMLDEWKIVGDGDFMKSMHQSFVYFKYPEELEQIFDFKIPTEPEAYESLLTICKKTIAHSIKSNHPHYMNSLYGGVDQFGVAGAWLTDALNSSAALWESSPVFAIVEKHMLAFLGRYTGFEQVEGHFCPGGSMANCYAMLLARHKLYSDIKEKGLYGKSRLVMITSDMAHYSFRKMAIMLGLGTDAVIQTKTDDMGRMIPEELEKAILKAKQDGFIPFMIAATAGTTVMGSFDQLEKIAAIAKTYNIWLHVDGAFGGTWLFSGKHRKLMAGLNLADSFAWDLHKMASLPIYCSVILTKHPGLFKEAFSLNAEYLFQADKYYNKDYDVGDFSIQCTRKVDAFKLYLFLKGHGLQRIEDGVNNVYDMSRFFEDQVSRRPNFRLIHPRSESNNICFHFIPDAFIKRENELTPEMRSRICTELKRRTMETGTIMVAYQSIPEKNIPTCFRITFSCLPVYTRDDINYMIQQFERFGKDLMVD